MIAKRERVWGRVVVLFFIGLVIMIGSGSYVYYVRHKEPTQGIFVDHNGVEKAGGVNGHLYQYS